MLAEDIGPPIAAEFLGKRLEELAGDAATVALTKPDAPAAAWPASGGPLLAPLLTRAAQGGGVAAATLQPQTPPGAPLSAERLADILGWDHQVTGGILLSRGAVCGLGSGQLGNAHTA